MAVKITLLIKQNKIVLLIFVSNHGYFQELMASKGRMEELAEIKCVFNWKFSCDNKSERLIEAGTARIQNIIRCSRFYDDDVHISLQEKLENNANFT